MSVRALHSILAADASYPGQSSGGIFSYVAADNASMPYTILYADDSDAITSQGNQAGLEWQDVIVAIYSSTTAEMNSIGDIARGLLDNYRGTVEGIVIRQCQYQGKDVEDYDRKYKKGTVELRFRVCRSV